MSDAVGAYQRNRFEEAARLAKQVATEAPDVPAVRELAGLAAYRSGRWREAIVHLDAHRHLVGALEHVPALMDCHRALGRPKKVSDLWHELRRQSPDPDVLSEARMVAAGMLADRRDVAGAIVLLVGAGAARKLRNPADRHVRQWYVLADLYERAGELPKAREMFQRVLAAAPGAYDVADRLDALGIARGGRGRTGRQRLRQAPAGLPASDVSKQPERAQ
jgi:tetratricopeptide (TPR) repeat protein